MERITTPPPLPERPAEGHKGLFGRVLVVGGNEGMIGAPVLALADPSGRGLRVTFGLVSATGRSFRGPAGRRVGGSIEHSAPLPRWA